MGKPRIHFHISGAYPWKWLLAGLLLRLLLLPIAAHSDFIHTWWASACIQVGQPVQLQVQTLLFWVHAAYLNLIAFLLPGSAQWCSNYSVLAGDFDSFPTWLAFLQQPVIFRTLALLKLPYLLFDIGITWLLFKMADTTRQSRWLALFWWLNPLTIYSIYVIGRHECIAIFFIVLSLYLLKREMPVWAFLALGIACAIRYYPLFLLPFFIASYPGQALKRLFWVVISLMPWILVNIIMIPTLGRSEFIPLINYPHDQYMLALRLRIAEWDWLYIFPLFYFLLFLHRLYNRELNLHSLHTYSLVALMLMMSFTYMAQAPHYWVWFIPFMGLIFSDNKIRGWFWLHAAQVVFLMMLGWIGNRATAGYLFASISPDFFWSLPGPVELITSFMKVEMFFSMAQTAFSAVTLWIIYLVFPRVSSINTANGKIDDTI